MSVKRIIHSALTGVFGLSERLNSHRKSQLALVSLSNSGIVRANSTKLVPFNIFFIFMLVFFSSL